MAASRHRVRGRGEVVVSRLRGRGGRSGAVMRSSGLNGRKWSAGIENVADDVDRLEIGEVVVECFRDRWVWIAQRWTALHNCRSSKQHDQRNVLVDAALDKLEGIGVANGESRSIDPRDMAGGRGRWCFDAPESRVRSDPHAIIVVVAR